MPQRILLILYQILVLSVVIMDSGFSLSKTQIARLEVIQNQGMRTILGCTRDTSCGAMCYTIGLLSMSERHMKLQVQAYMKVSRDKKHLLYDEVCREVYPRLKSFTEWMDKASRAISEVL